MRGVGRWRGGMGVNEAGEGRRRYATRVVARRQEGGRERERVVRHYSGMLWVCAMVAGAHALGAMPDVRVGILGV